MPHHILLTSQLWSRFSVPLIPVNKLLGAALSGGYAVGYFESWNLESLQGVIDAAEATDSPIMVGFNGEFLSHDGRHAREHLAWYAALGKAAAETATVPCSLVFNECAQDKWIRDAITLGFGQVMLDDPEVPRSDYVIRVKELAAFAHSRGVAIEAETGHLPSGADGNIDTLGSSATDPLQAEDFVLETGVDILSISVGNIHVLLDGSQGLDLERVAAIRDKVKIPLDLHGGTGIVLNDLREAIALGVAKVCYGTYVKQRYLEAVREALGTDQENPHFLLGYGAEEDIMVAGRHAVRDAVLERIDVLGCCGKVRQHG